ncbi:DnaB-like helicase C-terminal domain-containing protein [Desulfofundulus thermocisternus]|uniref:DnaB-like helicase C-terminal domain-containing protein n=1 Tax=Desulfofundulus thermocisternus TaxID=42471 RepID=UPI000483AA3C|nr:DnaB-like helicase C-terminal domain-containing protein [Desulfofundulus thermocisternus]
MESIIKTTLVNPELEARVLRALAAAGPEKFWELVDLLPPAAFPTHQAAYQALVDTFTADRPAPADLDLPEANIPPGFDLDAAATELAELARKRLVAEALERAWAGIPTKPAAEVIAELQEAVARAEAAVKELSAGGVTFAADISAEVLGWVQEFRTAREATGRAVIYPPIGIPALDRMLSGMAPGLWALLGAPGTGKTFFAIHLVVQYLRQPNTAVLYVTYEEPVNRLVLKCWCNFAGLKWDDYTAGYGDFAALQKAARDFAPLGARLAVLEGNQNTTTAHIRAKAAAVKARTKANHLMVVVDYLQLMANTAAGSVQDRAYQDSVRHRVGAVVAGLREIANRLDATVLAVSAMNRSSYKDVGTLAAARESSDIEYSADVFLRLQVGDQGVPPGAPKPVELHVLKNRNTGQTGVIPLVALVSQSRFGEATAGPVGEDCPF